MHDFRLYIDNRNSFFKKKKIRRYEWCCGKLVGVGRNAEATHSCDNKTKIYTKLRRLEENKSPENKQTTRETRSRVLWKETTASLKYGMIYVGFILQAAWIVNENKGYSTQDIRASVLVANGF